MPWLHTSSSFRSFLAASKPRAYRRCRPGLSLRVRSEAERPAEKRRTTGLAIDEVPIYQSVLGLFQASLWTAVSCATLAACLTGAGAIRRPSTGVTTMATEGVSLGKQLASAGACWWGVASSLAMASRTHVVPLSRSPHWCLYSRRCVQTSASGTRCVGCISMDHMCGVFLTLVFSSGACTHVSCCR